MLIGLLTLKHVDVVVPIVDDKRDLWIVITIGYIQSKLSWGQIILPSRVHENLPAFHSGITCTSFSEVSEFSQELLLNLLSQCTNLLFCRFSNCHIVRSQFFLHLDGSLLHIGLVRCGRVV